jgi:hypothetical protein
MALSPSRVFYLYGVFLILGGFLAFGMAGFEARAKTAILMGCGCGVVMCIVGYLGESRPGVIMKGRYLLAFFLCLFLYRGFKIRDVVEKQYLFICFMILSAGTAIALLLQLTVARMEKANTAVTSGTTKTRNAAAKQQQD